MIKKLIRRWRVSEITFRLPLIDVSLRPEEDFPVAEQPIPVAQTLPITAVEVTEAVTEIPIPSSSPLFNDTQFARLKAAIAAEPYGSDQITVFKGVPPEVYFTVAQVAEIVDMMNYSDEKLEVVKISKKRLADPENTYLLPAHFPYGDDKEEVMKLFRR